MHSSYIANTTCRQYTVNVNPLTLLDEVYKILRKV